jgi:cytochrome c5/osmotically-inducible protein OsmY
MTAAQACWILAACLLAAPAAAQPAGQKVFDEKCGTCHAAGVAGAPRLGDTREWTRRIAAGPEALQRSALLGMPNSAMPAKGGFAELSATEVRAAVDYMIAAAQLSPAVLKAAAVRGAQHPAFARFDANADGAVSRAEAGQEAEVLALFAQYDANRDGQLSEAEFLKLDAALANERTAAVVDDATLAAAVAKALAAAPGVPAVGIRVEAAAGIVTLRGAVDASDEGVRAETAARRVRGVKQVDNKLVSKHALGFD